MSGGISVALATLDGARFVAEQVRSILSQTTPVDEIVVGDDGSRDGTLDVVRREVERSSVEVRLRILDGASEGGVAANFTRILAATRGELVLLSDQDDVWRRDRVASAVRRFADDPALDALFGDARLVDADGRPLGSTLFGALPVREAELDAVIHGRAVEVLLRRNIATGATMAVRRTALDRALPVAEGWIHDEWLAITTALVGKLGVERRTLVDYRQHGGNAIGVSSPSLGRRLTRLTERRGDRNARLAVAAASLLAWATQAGVADVRLADKAKFESARASFPKSRLARLPGIVRMLPLYSANASQGRLDVLRDLVQPH